jgi:hypothetical protein
MSRLSPGSNPAGRVDPRQYVVKIFGKTRADARHPNAPYHGTGFLLNSKGHVATAWHVVEDAATIFVKVPADPEEYVYDFLVERRTEDIAVLRPHVWSGLNIPRATLHPDWFDEDRFGEAVSVWGYSSPAATASAQPTPCHIRGPWGKFGLIMLDGQLYEGDSGGPVINEDEHVIGILSVVDPKRESHAMARPISRLCKLLTDEKDKGINFHIGVGGGQLAEQAIDLLLELLTNPEVRAAVQASLRIFEEASRQISILYAYKKVHDLLHEVEFGCYNSMVIDVRDFPEQEAAREKISIHIFRLSKYLSSAEDIVREASERGERIVRVHEQLNKAYEALQDADHAQDPAHYRRSIQLLRLLLSRAQSTFNLLLNQAARELHIDTLVAAMQGVQEGIVRAELPLNTAGVFQQGVDDLAALGRDLHTRTAEHDRWQQVDDVLRGVESNSPGLLSDLEVFWPLIMSELKAVCELARTTSPAMVDAQPADWRVRIAREMTNLQEALTRSDPKGARRHFENLYQQAADRLDRIDKRLLQVCDKISKVRDPLRTLVGAVK